MIKDGVFWFISAGVVMMTVGQWINYKYPLPPDLQKQYIFRSNAAGPKTTGGV
jgi:hypothetical protein